MSKLRASSFTSIRALAGWLVVLVATTCAAGCAAEPRSSGTSTLVDYVQSQDKSFSYSVRSTGTEGGIRKALLDMTSQTWQGIPWKHQIELFCPETVLRPRVALLVVTGGSPGGRESMVARAIADKTSCVTAVLYGIPNQPLWNRNEDALIAYTFAKMIETGDTTWPLLLPMTKSAVRAMDVVQEVASKNWRTNVRGFVVSGASKRGWTTWLTAAADPQRVRAIVPLVYDNLNLPAQMRQQKARYDAYSEKIGDYTALGLPDMLGSAEGGRISRIVDPWEYRKTLTMTKVIVNGTNDPYWTVDSLNLYWDGLPARKYVMYFANGGHDLGINGVEALPRAARLVSAYDAVIRLASAGPAPVVSWEHKTTGQTHTLSVKTNAGEGEAHLWAAVSASADFRKAKWASEPMKAVAGGYAGETPLPTAGFKAVYADFPAKLADGSITLSTQIEVLDSKGPVASGN